VTVIRSLNCPVLGFRSGSDWSDLDRDSIQHRVSRDRLDDLLVEYAVASEPTVNGSLIQIIEALLQHPALYETLKILITTDGNGSQTAERLLIHRSTLDYRLNQIERLTGHAPSSSRALQVLGAALTAHTATRCMMSMFPAWDV